ncbi:kinase-like protein [Phlegmacium glaucopus]|nr:kinase-like protein [Phlegmacium glaucopus]
MSRLSYRLLGGQDPLTYLNNVKASFGNADLTTFHIFLSEVDAWIRQQDSGLDFTRLARIATLLQFKPHLLQGFNALLRPNHRLECSTNVRQVRYFVIVTPKGANIISPTRLEVPFPTSDAELRSLVLLKSWRGLLGGPRDEDWLICIASLLQVILDDPATDVICYGRAYDYLRELARDSILAPSVLVNDLKVEPGQAVHGEAFADIHKGSVAGTYIRLRVLRMFDKKIEKSQNLYKDLCSEVITWRQLNHPNILPFIGANTELFSPRYCFLSSWASNGDLISYLKQHPEHDRFNSIHEIVEGINYLHSLNPPITHKDIKGANVHVNGRLVCCLADFGLSVIVKSQRLRREPPAFQGSVCWTAPEVMDPARSQGQDPRAGDIYSLACTIYEVYTGSPPLFSMYKLSRTILLAVLLGERAELPPPGTWAVDEEEMWWLVGHCWADKPQDRPNINLIRQALRDIRTPKLAATDPPDASSDDARYFTTDLGAVKAWLRDEAVGFGMILSNHFPQSPFNIFKLDGGARLSDGQFVVGKVHPSPRERLFSRRHQSVAFRKSAKVEASREIAETLAYSNHSPSTSSSQASNDSLSLPTPPSSSTTQVSLPTPPRSPASSHKTHVVNPSGLRPDAPPYIPLGTLKVSSPPSGVIRATPPLLVPTCHFQKEDTSESPLYRMIKPLVDNPADIGALRRFLVHKLALHSLVRREVGASL